MLKPLLETLDLTGVEPDAWSRACDELAWLLRSSGVILAPYSTTEQTLDVPVSPAMQGILEDFHTAGWSKRDPRARAFPALMTGAVVTDLDLFSPREIERHEFYADFLRGHDLKWFAAAGFAVDDAFWAVSVHRAAKGEPFSPDDLAILRDVMEPFQAAARRARALGQTRTDSLEGFLATARRGIAILGWNGRIVRLSEQAETMLRRHNLISQGRLRSKEAKTQRYLDLLVARGLAQGRDSREPPLAPLIVRADDAPGLVLDLVPMPRDFAALLAGAAALVTVHEVSLPAEQAWEDVQARYGLTPREAQLCTRLASGKSLSTIAEEMGISVETARQYLKSVFAKTDTSRQAELVILLSSGQQDR